eukprot:900806-Pelagomonas_calceolata.AAC.1
MALTRLQRTSLIFNLSGIISSSRQQDPKNHLKSQGPPWPRHQATLLPAWLVKSGYEASRPKEQYLRYHSKWSLCPGASDTLSPRLVTGQTARVPGPCSFSKLPILKTNSAHYSMGLPRESTGTPIYIFLIIQATQEMQINASF